MKSSIKVLCMFLAFIISTSVFSGCTSDNTFSAADKSAVTLLIGKNKLSGELSLDSTEMNNDVTHAAMNEGIITAVELDGSPFIISQQVVKEDQNNKSTARKQHLASTAQKALASEIYLCDPRSPEIDFVSGLNTAIDTLRSSNVSGSKILYILFSGFSSAGILNMTRFNMFETNIALLAKELSPYVHDLHGITVKWLNLGDVNSAIQQVPDRSQINHLKKFYKTLIKIKGGSVEFLSDRTTNLVNTNGFPYVTPIYVPQNSLTPQKIDYKLGSDKVSFKPREAKLLDEQKAANAVRSISKEIINSGQSITLIGSTASFGNDDECLELAEKRCLVILGMLVKDGVDEKKVTIHPIGRDASSPLRVNDLDSKGRLIESEGQKNRFVYITSDPGLLT